jgi:Family of unknown function (DUF6085)
MPSPDEVLKPAVQAARKAALALWLDRAERHVEASPEEHVAVLVDAALSALAKAYHLVPREPGDEHHILDVREDGWTLRHPLTCRPQLFECPITQQAGRLDEPPAPVGRYRVVADPGEEYLRLVQVGS